MKHAPSSPFYLQWYLPIVIDWTLTTGLITCKVQPGSAYGPCPPPADNEYRKTSITEMAVLIAVNFWGVEQDLIPNIW